MKIICVGRNYAAHIEELNNEKTQDPVLFLKPDTAILQKKQPFFIPHFSSNIHYEAEIIVRIDRIGKHIQPEFAHKYYKQISLGVDFTARDFQNQLKHQGLPWEKAKAFDGSAVIGDWVDKNEWGDLQNLSFELQLNGSPVQQGNTSQMLWSIDDLIAYASTFFTLKIGDIIFTGTPQGVGAVKQDDFLEGFVANKKLFSLKIK